MRRGARRVSGIGIQLDLALWEALAAAAVVETPAGWRVAEGLEGAVMLPWPAPAVADKMEAADLGSGDGDHKATRWRCYLQVQQIPSGANVVGVRGLRLVIRGGVDAQRTLSVLGFDNDGCGACDFWLKEMRHA